MTIQEAILARHSVRSYLDKPIPADVLSALQAAISACNAEGKLHIQLVVNEPKAFDSLMGHYGKFSGVQNYIALIGKREADLEERLGYYGERIALLAQTLGLNTCWVAASFSKGETKKNCAVDRGERLVCVLALGYGATAGVPHVSKPMDKLCRVEGQMPDWFRAGMEAAMLAPTAVNQQQFRFTLAGDGDTVRSESLGGFFSKTDLGIVRYHFEIGAGRKIS